MHTRANGSDSFAWLITQVAWMRMQLDSSEPDAVMLTEGTVEAEAAEVTGRLHDAGNVDVHMLSSLLFTTFRALSVM